MPRLPAQKRTRGLFITFEGTEGAGKSTLIRALETKLKSNARFAGRGIVLTREPGGTELAEAIRAVILGRTMSARTELLLYEAARSEHVESVLKPNLDANAVVLCDRYADSSLAYQAHARGLVWNEVERLNDFATRGLRPDLTVLIDIDPAVGLARARERNRFELEGEAFQAKVRQGFLKAARREPKRWLVLKPKAEDSPEQMAARLAELIDRRFRK